MIDAKMITTALELPGYRVTRNLGVVRGIIVRSRSIVGNIGASLQTLVGGNISIYTNLCEKAREDAHRLMVEHAAQLGANAIIGVRYDANEITPGSPKSWLTARRFTSTFSGDDSIQRLAKRRRRILGSASKPDQAPDGRATNDRRSAQNIGQRLHHDAAIGHDIEDILSGRQRGAAHFFNCQRAHEAAVRERHF